MNISSGTIQWFSRIIFIYLFFCCCALGGDPRKGTFDLIYTLHAHAATVLRCQSVVCCCLVPFPIASITDIWNIQFRSEYLAYFTTGAKITHWFTHYDASIHCGFFVHFKNEPKNIYMKVIKYDSPFYTILYLIRKI